MQRGLKLIWRRPESSLSKYYCLRPFWFQCSSSDVSKGLKCSLLLFLCAAWRRMCLSLCVPWPTPPCLAPCMSSSHVTASWFAAAWTRARSSLGCVLMTPRKGKHASTWFCMNYNIRGPFKTRHLDKRFPLGHQRNNCKLPKLNCLNKPKTKLCSSLQVCRLRLHPDHQECPFPPWWTVSSGHHWRKTLPGPVQRKEGWLQHCWHWALGRQQGKKNHNNYHLNDIIDSMLCFYNHTICVFNYETTFQVYRSWFLGGVSL